MSVTPEDHVGIHNLYARYPILMDEDDEDGLADCFTADGVFRISGQGSHRGPEEIKALVRKTAAGRPRHITVNLWIKGVEDGTASTTAYFLLVDIDSGETVAYGRYTDVPVRCDDGVWRWRERQVQFEWTSAGYAAQDRAKAIPLD